tara:strand:+ start:17291 stop:17545 length:255 start_codon:yes stop_codon:yes gene_type:complete
LGTWGSRRRARLRTRAAVEHTAEAEENKEILQGGKEVSAEDAGSEYWRMWEELDAEHFTVVDAAGRMAAFAATGLPPLYRTNRV